MSDVPTMEELARAVRIEIPRYSCAEEDATVYAVEDLVTATLGARIIHESDVEPFVHEVCSLHDINPPNVMVSPSSSRFVGTAFTDHHLMCLHRTRNSVLTVLHEIAHFMSKNDAHGRRFRDSYVRLVREHVGVEHASMLHGLYRKCGLEVSAWKLLRR